MVAWNTWAGIVTAIATVFAAGSVFWLAVIERRERTRLAEDAKVGRAISTGAEVFQALATFNAIHAQRSAAERKLPGGQAWVHSLARNILLLATSRLSTVAESGVFQPATVQLLVLAEHAILRVQRQVREAALFPRDHDPLDDVIFREVESATDITERAATAVWAVTNPGQPPFWSTRTLR